MHGLVLSNIKMLVSGCNVLSGYCPSIAVSPRFHDNQSPCCAECTTKSNTMKQQTRIFAVECGVEKCGQKNQHMVNCINSRVDCAQRRINGRKLRANASRPLIEAK